MACLCWFSVPAEQNEKLWLITKGPQNALRPTPDLAGLRTAAFLTSIYIVGPGRWI